MLERAAEVAVGDSGPAERARRERVRVGRLGRDQADAVRGEVEVLEERRGHGERVHGRAEVMGQLGDGGRVRAGAQDDVVAERRGAGTSADGRLGLEDEDVEACSCERHGGGEPVRAGAHDDDVSHPRSSRRSSDRVHHTTRAAPPACAG